MLIYIYIYNNGVIGRVSWYWMEKRGEKKEILFWKGKENFLFLKLILMIIRRIFKFVNVIIRGGKMVMIIDKLYWRRGFYIYM